MLSPGKWHLKVPKGPANARFRIALLKAAKNDRVLQKGILDACRKDILFFINVFVIQYNPKKPPGNRVAPFITWDFQDAALLDTPETTGKKGILWYYEHQKGCVIEKSREMGASWLFLIVQLWICLFEDHAQLLNISRDSDSVDCKSPDSLFWKLRHMHEHLPDWMKGKIIEQKMYIEYKRTKAVITGEASTGDAGVGGRASTIFIDEYPKIKDAVEVRQRTANTADCRFFNGTHLGTDTEFYRLTVSPEIGKIVMHWTQHPDKNKGLYRVGKNNRVDILDKTYVFPPDYRFVLDGSPTGGPFPGVRSPWYDSKCHDIGSSRGVAMELDIDPKGSTSQFFDSLVIRELIDTYTCPPYWEGDLEYDRDLGRPHELVRRPGGRLKLWMHPDAEGQIPFGRYALATDVAQGSGATPSIVSGGNAATMEKILEYADANIDAKDLAVLCVALCWLFRDEEGQGALFCWEIPGPGQTLGTKVIELGYRNIHYRSSEYNLVEVTSDLPGWVNTPRNKLDLLSQYRTALRKGDFINRSEAALDECRMFKYGPGGMVEHTNERSPNDPSGARLNHADRGMADAMLNKMLKRLGGSEAEKLKQEVPEGSMQWRRELREMRHREQEQWA